MNTDTRSHVTHAKTGLPVQEVPTFAVGDLVSENIGSDSYPAVVVAVTPKTVWVRHVAYVVNAQANDVPGYNGYGDSATLVIDPEDVDQAVAQGKTGASKYILRVAGQASYASGREQDQYGQPRIHRARWARPGGYGSVTPGASYRQDPHF